MIKQFFITLLFLCISVFGYTQTFSWAQCTVNTGMEYIDVCVGKNNSILVLADYTSLSYRTAEEMFFDAKGRVKIEQWWRSSQILFCFDSEGKLKWHAAIQGKDNRIEKITSTKGGDFVLLTQIEGTHTSMPGEKHVKNQATPSGNRIEDDDEEEEEEDETDSDELPLRYGKFQLNNQSSLFCRAGWNIVHLNADGKLIKIDSLGWNEEQDFEMTQFKTHPDGDLLISGHFVKGRISPSPDHAAGISGAMFLAKVGTDGKLRWADVSRSQSPSCCSMRGDLSHVSVSADGWIVHSGTLYGGGVFGGQIVTSDLRYSPGAGSSDFMDGFLACYDPKGKLQWVKTAGTINGYCNAVVSTSDRIFVSFNLHSGERLYGEKMDTSMRKRSFLLSFDRKGNFLRARSMTTTIHHVVVSGDNSLMIYGDVDRYNKSRVFDEQVSFGERDLMFLATMDKNLNVTGFHGFRLLVSRNGEQDLIPLSNGDAIMWGQLWGALPIEANILDKAFPAAKVYGGSPYCGYISKDVFTPVKK
jgi:hypothetical protein